VAFGPAALLGWPGMARRHPRPPMGGLLPATHKGVAASSPLSFFFFSFFFFNAIYELFKKFKILYF
jgi:hypothetical protein